MRWFQSFGPVVATLALCGCSSAADPETPVGTLHSESGSRTATFEFTPSVPVVGNNELHTQLFDTGLTPLSNCTLAAEVWMPAHGHGSSVTPEILEVAPGEYRATNVVFEMPGRWEIRVDVFDDAERDRFILPVTVD